MRFSWLMSLFVWVLCHINLSKLFYAKFSLYTYHHHPHHHQVMLSARISLTLPATLLYRPSLPAGPQGYILYRHRAVVYWFKLAVLPLFVHVMWSTGVCHLWVHPNFSQKCPACLVRLTFRGGCNWLYSCCFVGCCFHDLFSIARIILA